MADKEEPKKKQSTIKQIIQIYKYTQAKIRLFRGLRRRVSWRL